MYVRGGVYLCGGSCARGLVLARYPKATNKKTKHFDDGSLRVRSRYCYGWEDSSRTRDSGRRGQSENESSWDFVDNSDPVIPAATAAEGHESDLIQWQWNPVGGDVVLDVVCDALAEGLDGEAKQSALDRDTVPG